MLIYVIRQYYYSEMLLVEAFTDRAHAEIQAIKLNEAYADSEHYYEVEAIDLDNYEDDTII